MSQSECHCWKDRHEWIEERYGFGSGEWAANYNLPSATCMLAHGHDGEHEWTNDDEIGVSFVEAP